MLAFFGPVWQPLFGGIPEGKLLVGQGGPVVVLVVFLAVAYAVLWFANELTHRPSSPKRRHGPSAVAR